MSEYWFSATAVKLLDSCHQLHQLKVVVKGIGEVIDDCIDWYYCVKMNSCEGTCH